jgi:hypothetical protein
VPRAWDAVPRAWDVVPRAWDVVPRAWDVVPHERVILKHTVGGPARASPRSEKASVFKVIYFIINHLKNNLKL